MVGFFVNLLPVMTKLSLDETLGRLIRRVQKDLQRVQAHADLPFDEIVSIANSAGAERSAFNRVFLEFGGEALVRMPEIAGIDAEDITQGRGDNQFDLSLSVSPVKDGLHLSWHYVAELLDDDVVRAMAHDFLQVLGGMSQTTRVIDIFPEHATGHRVLMGDENVEDVITRVRAMVDAQPDAIAITGSHGCLTYADFFRRALSYAHALEQAGCSVGDFVGVCLQDRVEQVIVIYGVLLTGCAYVALDVTLPRERASSLTSRCAMQVAIVDDRGAALLHDNAIMFVKTQGNDGRDAPAGYVGREVHPEHPAYVIFTSGSTGKPKGVVVTRKALALNTMEYAFWLGLSDSDVILHFFPTSFDASVEQMFPTLAYGAQLVVLEETEKTPHDVLNAVINAGITTMVLPTAFFPQWARVADVDCNVTLRNVIVGGEALFGEDVKRWRSGPCASVELGNIYGPSEITVACCAARTSIFSEMSGAVPIGQPFKARRMSVRHLYGSHAPIGVEGEICVGGVGLALGYLGNPRTTAESFIPDEYGDGERLYRTGDLGRIDLNNNFEFSGRRDRQIKLRGYRIEPGEIEAALRDAFCVSEAAVELETVGNIKNLVGYIVTDNQDNASFHTQDLINLPKWMRPASIHAVSALPRLSNGKLDRSRLKALVAQTSPATKNHEAPRNAYEHLLMRIWMSVLGRDDIGINDNFFALGGDSILAMQIISEVRDCGLLLSMKQILSNPTIKELGAIVRREKDTEQARVAIKDQTDGNYEIPDEEPTVDLEDYYPATPLQAGMLFHGEILPDQGVYVSQMTVRLRGSLNVAAMKTAWQKVTDKYTILRTIFSRGADGNYLQSVMRRMDIGWVEYDWSHQSSGAYMRALQDWKTADRRKGFRTESGPLMRVTLFRRNHEDFDLIWTIHHAIMDGWGAATLLSEVVGNYRSVVSGEVLFEKEGFRYRDFVEWQAAQESDKSCGRIA